MKCCFAQLQQHFDCMHNISYTSIVSKEGLSPRKANLLNNNKSDGKMSSLAAAQADGYYYPPGWDPSKGSLNKFQKSHPLRERAKKIDQGIIVVRFEMPYNSFCEGCGKHIAMGVRFNAEKKTVDQYFSTPILEFSMKCPQCDQRLVMRTDPKNAEYICVSGVRKKIETYDADSAEAVELKDNETAKKLATDPLFQLEYKERDKAKARSREADIEDVMEMQKVHKDDFAANSMLRRKMRETKRQNRERERTGKDKGLVIPLQPASAEDIIKASYIHFAKDNEEQKYANAARMQRKRAVARPILKSNKSNKRGRTEESKGLGLLSKPDPNSSIRRGVISVSHTQAERYPGSSVRRQGGSSSTHGGRETGQSAIPKKLSEQMEMEESLSNEQSENSSKEENCMSALSSIAANYGSEEDSGENE